MSGEEVSAGDVKSQISQLVDDSEENIASLAGHQGTIDVLVDNAQARAGDSEGLGEVQRLVRSAIDMAEGVVTAVGQDAQRVDAENADLMRSKEATSGLHETASKIFNTQDTDGAAAVNSYNSAEDGYDEPEKELADAAWRLNEVAGEVDAAKRELETALGGFAAAAAKLEEITRVFGAAKTGEGSIVEALHSAIVSANSYAAGT